MWYSPESETLSEAGRERAYRIQCELGSVKVCRTCGQTKPVSEFSGYGAANCNACGDDMERWWASMRRKAGIAA